MNETEVAAGIATGSLESPQRFGESFLLACRISGTGISERPALAEKVFRDPLIWLAESTQARCNGLTVTLDHPESAVLNTEEYAARAVGAIILPYVADRAGIQNEAGPDLWGVARLFLDADMMGAISKQSTSPGVAFTKSDGNQRITLDDGTDCLVEASPSDINHVAIVLGGDGAGDGAGVWDKGDPESRGLRFDSKGTAVMDETEMAADKARKDAVEEKTRKDAEAASGMGKVLEGLDSISKRLDALEKRGDARKDADETKEEKEKREAAERVDAARKDLATSEHGTPWNAAKATKDREEDAEKCATQARCDIVAQAFGQRAPMPLQGEKPLAYRKRLLRGFQRHSVFKDANLDAVVADPATFSQVETQIYADALVASRTPETVAGQLLKRTRVDEHSGHRITEFFGSPTIFKQFAMPSFRATAFLTPQHTGANRG
jgi:colicin import membrane protein